MLHIICAYQSSVRLYLRGLNSMKLLGCCRILVLFQTLITLNASSGSESITHVISENNCVDEVTTWLESHIRGQSLPPAHLLDISWYTESMHAGHPVEILERHKLQVPFLLKSNYFGKCRIGDGKMARHLQFIYSRLFGIFQEPPDDECEDVVFFVPSYACQRRTTLQNHNTVLTVCPSGYTDLTEQEYLNRNLI